MVTQLAAIFCQI